MKYLRQKVENVILVGFVTIDVMKIIFFSGGIGDWLIGR
jgi:hypothetical protein